MNQGHCPLCRSLQQATPADPVYACRSTTCLIGRAT